MNTNINFDNVHIEKELKIVYMGTPEFSDVVLKGLLEKYKIRAIVTQPDKVSGRKNEIKFSPVKQTGIDHAILVLQPNKIRDDYAEILRLEPDLIITCAYGQIIPRELLVYPKYGCINVHASLLPKLRGGAPIQHAIMDGYKKTGVTIMYMNEKMDEGDMITSRELEILDTDTCETLHDKLSEIGRDLLLETLPNILSGNVTRTPQDNTQATYGLTIRREDEKINFNKTKREIFNQVRGLNSWPGAYCLLDGKILKIWKCYTTDNNFSMLMNGQITNIYSDGIGVKVENGEIVITELQPEGKRKMSASDFINGIADKDTFKKKMLS